MLRKIRVWNSTLSTPRFLIGASKDRWQWRVINANLGECVALFAVAEILKNKVCPLRLLPSSKRWNRHLRLGLTKHPTCWARMSWKAVRSPSVVGGCHTWNGRWLTWNGNQNPMSDRQVNLKFLQLNERGMKRVLKANTWCRSFPTTASDGCKYCSLIG